MATITAGDFRNGVTFEMDGQVMQVVEFQHVKPSAGLQGPVQAGHSARQVFEVADAERYGGGVEPSFAVSGRLGVSLRQPDAAGESFPFHLFAADGQHPFGEVDAGDLRCGTRFGQHDGQVARAGRHIQDFGGPVQAHHSHHPAAPSPVDAERQQVVQQVVPAGDPVEHRSHLFFFAFRLVIGFHRSALFEADRFLRQN